MNDNSFSLDTLDRIVAETFIGQIDYNQELSSTNNRGLELAREQSEIPIATLVLTERQTAGRGRGKNRWWSGEGGLAFSVLVNCGALKLPTSCWPKISLTTGLAVCDAIEKTIEVGDAKLKWPNDVYLSGCKACGILVEAPDSRRARVVIGIGINVNNTTALAPLELRGHAISLSDIAQQTIEPTEVLIQVLQQLAERLTSLARGTQDLRRDWHTRCLLTGQSVEIDLDTRHLIGVCHGIDDDGALVLETEFGIERCLSGTVSDFTS